VDSLPARKLPSTWPQFNRSTTSNNEKLYF